MAGKSRSALVLEGGGMRGIFSAGVLDAFYEEGFDPFDLYIGVSAGACNLSSHLAGQHLRNHFIMTELMTRPEFISPAKFLSGGHWMDLDWLWDTIAVQWPLDVPSILRHLKKRKREFLIVATDADTGGPLYLQPNGAAMLHTLKVSSAVPLLYRGFPEAGGRPATDGGVSDPIPVREAWRRGARTIVAVRTRPPEYVKKRGLETAVSYLAFRGRKGLARAVLRQPDVYAEGVRFLHGPPEGTRVIEIAPERPLRTGRTTQDRDALEADYRLGLQMGRQGINRF